MDTRQITLISMQLLLIISSLVHAAPQSDSRLLGALGICENKVEHLCDEELRAHYCYLEHNRNLCCRTCQTLRRPDPECPYGDHYTRIVRKGADGQNKTYTCEAYIKFYGKHHCLVDQKFRQYCCESCKGA